VQGTATNSAAAANTTPPLSWATLGEGKSSERMVSIVNKSQKPNKKAVSSERIIRLLLIILWAVVVIVSGFCSGFAYHHH